MLVGMCVSGDGTHMRRTREGNRQRADGAATGISFNNVSFGLSEWPTCRIPSAPYSSFETERREDARQVVWLPCWAQASRPEAGWTGTHRRIGTGGLASRSITLDRGNGSSSAYTWCQEVVMNVSASNALTGRE